MHLGFELLRNLILMGKLDGTPTKEIVIIDGGDVHKDDVRVSCNSKGP